MKAILLIIALAFLTSCSSFYKPIVKGTMMSVEKEDKYPKCHYYCIETKHDTWYLKR